MVFMVEIYSVEPDVLEQIASETQQLAVESEAPAPVEAPGALDLDLANLGKQLWELAVAFGGITASLEAVSAIIGIVRDRQEKGLDTTIEIALPDGVKVTFTGKMTPEEAASEMDRFREKVEELSSGTA